jgi:tight adherence protein B
MSTLPLLLLVAGVLGTLFVMYSAFAGPSPARAGARRLDALRERHSKSSDVAAQAQMKRILATRTSRWTASPSASSPILPCSPSASSARA